MGDMTDLGMLQLRVGAFIWSDDSERDEDNRSIAGGILWRILSVR